MTDLAETTPEPQRLRALGQANAIRLARAELKRRIAEGRITAAEVILTCPPEAHRWTLGELLVSQRRWGTTRCRKFLERNGLTEIKPIGALTDRQRHVLASQLGRRPEADRDLELARERALAGAPRELVLVVA